MAKVEIYKRVNGRPMDDFIAHMEPVQLELHHTATEMAHVAQTVLDTGSKKRTGNSRIYTERGRKLDWFVVLDDLVDEHAAGAIELGAKGGRGGVAPLRTAAGLMMGGGVI